jgi:hypothetical protein
MNMANLLNLINTYLGPISAVIGILTFIQVVPLWLDLVWGRRSRHKKWMQEAIANTGRLPAVLIVDLLPGKDISTVVRHFMAGQEALKAIPEERIIKIDRGNQLKPEDMTELARDIQDATGKILEHGADELYVFLAGPVCAAAMVGAELSNVSCKVILYQNTDSTYVNFGPLRHPRF